MAGATLGTDKAIRTGVDALSGYQAARKGAGPDVNYQPLQPGLGRVAYWAGYGYGVLQSTGLTKVIGSLGGR